MLIADPNNFPSRELGMVRKGILQESTVTDYDDWFFLSTRVLKIINCDSVTDVKKPQAYSKVS